MAIIEVSFKGNRREFFLWDAEEVPAVNTPVIVDADRGEDLGHVHSIGEAAEHRNRGVPHGTGGQPPERHARRVATADDVRRLDDLRSQDEDARRKAMERVRANALEMKLSDAEWQWDRKKLTFYFTAEKRVDFRTLVRELASTFRTRIELKQIGVRDEAKRLDGIGRCGRQYCSASWLPELRPVSLGVAKDQRLSLNPTQISGACGRLMCSLRYEHEFYVEARRRFPKEGKIIRFATGEEKVVANDIFRERVTLRNTEGETRTIPLAQLLQEAEAAGSTITPAIAGRPASPPRPARPQVDDEDESLDEEAETADPSHSLGMTSTADPSHSLGMTPSTPEPSAEGQDRRPHRRRGRRGGRRNRGRRDQPGGGSPEGTTPPPGGEPA
ncbi:MAG TPA: regulatory iron-sulfur-containing complex subunit RicT [Gemmatimonadaceae bacterium]|nr:regulatory iron-sulfur-containing complex subunit RicT [Gemmatimonadaceae bacterium]